MLATFTENGPNFYSENSEIFVFWVPWKICERLAITGDTWEEAKALSPSPNLTWSIVRFPWNISLENLKGVYEGLEFINWV